jgi:hypothetical protein
MIKAQDARTDRETRREEGGRSDVIIKIPNKTNDSRGQKESARKSCCMGQDVRAGVVVMIRLDGVMG